MRKLLVPWELPVFKHSPRTTLLSTAHTILLLVAMLAAPFVGREMPELYSNGYAPYGFFPGSHIYIPSMDLLFDRPTLVSLSGVIGKSAAFIACGIVGPGIVGLLAGGLQWYLLGTLWTHWSARPQRIDVVKGS